MDAASFVAPKASCPLGRSELNQWLVAKTQMRIMNRMSSAGEVLRM